MIENEDKYSSYFEHNKIIAQVLSLFSGFIFTSITLLLTRLNNIQDTFACNSPVSNDSFLYLIVRVD